MSKGPSFADGLCSDLLSTRSPGKNTEGLIVYLSALLENQVIGDPELLRFMEGLEAGKIINPIAQKQTEINSAAMIHHEGIQEYIKDQNLDQKRLLEWARQSLVQRERVRQAREKIREVTEGLYQRMEFNPVSAGTFMMGDSKKRVKITLTHPFEMMSTPVTQKMWVDRMGENPASYVKGDHAKVVTILGKAVKMLPDHPVEQLSWWSALVYANRLSEKMGFKPAYDLSRVKFKPGTRAEDGTLVVEKGKVRINAPNGNIYLAEGYRLPTEAEMEYVMRAMGSANGLYHFGDNKADLKDYAWYDLNSDDETHAVAQLKPLVINGKCFYDLHGNVWEWVHDQPRKRLKAGADPQGTNPQRTRSDFSFRGVSGGAWCDHAYAVRTGNRHNHHPKMAFSYIGFRLVRTLR